MKERDERDVSDFAFLSEAYIRATGNKISNAETKKMLRAFRKRISKKKSRYERALNVIEGTVENAADKMQKKKLREYPPNVGKRLLKDANPDREMAGQTLKWNLQNLQSQKRKPGRISKPIPRY